MRRTSIAAALVLLTLWVARLAAGPPARVQYQGLALDASGAPPAGPVDVTLRLHTHPTASSEVWTESHLDVPTQDGVFSLLLGSLAPLDPELFAAHDGLWLEVVIEGETLTPRQRIASAPYALQAGCNPGDMVDCFTGDPARLGIGVCVQGRRRCGTAGTWEACQGEVLPGAEPCADALDNHCDGSSDCADSGCVGSPECVECVIDAGCPPDGATCGACAGFSSACDQTGTQSCTCRTYDCVAGSAWRAAARISRPAFATPMVFHVAGAGAAWARPAWPFAPERPPRSRRSSSRPRPG